MILSLKSQFSKGFETIAFPSISFWLLSWFFSTCQVNSYPTVRGFIAIGTGGDDFVQAMVVAVESVIQQPIPEVHILIFNFETQLLINMSV